MQTRRTDLRDLMLLLAARGAVQRRWPGQEPEDHEAFTELTDHLPCRARQAGLSAARLGARDLPAALRRSVEAALRFRCARRDGREHRCGDGCLLPAPEADEAGPTINSLSGAFYLFAPAFNDTVSDRAGPRYLRLVYGSGQLTIERNRQGGLRARLRSAKGATLRNEGIADGVILRWLRGSARLNGRRLRAGEERIFRRAGRHRLEVVGRGVGALFAARGWRRGAPFRLASGATLRLAFPADPSGRPQPWQLGARRPGGRVTLRVLRGAVEEAARGRMTAGDRADLDALADPAAALSVRALGGPARLVIDEPPLWAHRVSLEKTRGGDHKPAIDLLAPGVDPRLPTLDDPEALARRLPAVDLRWHRTASRRRWEAEADALEARYDALSLDDYEARREALWAREPRLEIHKGKLAIAIRQALEHLAQPVERRLLRDALYARWEGSQQGSAWLSDTRTLDAPRADAPDGHVPRLGRDAVAELSLRRRVAEALEDG